MQAKAASIGRGTKPQVLLESQAQGMDLLAPFQRKSAHSHIRKFALSLSLLAKAASSRRTPKIRLTALPPYHFTAS